MHHVEILACRENFHQKSPVEVEEASSRQPQKWLQSKVRHPLLQDISNNPIYSLTFIFLLTSNSCQCQRSRWCRCWLSPSPSSLHCSNQNRRCRGHSQWVDILERNIEIESEVRVEGRTGIRSREGRPATSRTRNLEFQSRFSTSSRDFKCNRNLNINTWNFQLYD